MEKEDQFLLSHIEDQFRRCEDRNIPAYTGFLDMRQQTIASDFCRSIGARPQFLGGYDDAERRVCAFLPDYLDETTFDGIACVRVQTAAALPKPLTHRDYLGALMGMGIERETVGDILAREDGADILVLHDMLGLNHGFKPKFLRHFAQLADEVKAAVGEYINAVKDSSFPNIEESY